MRLAHCRCGRLAGRPTGPGQRSAPRGVQLRLHEAAIRRGEKEGHIYWALAQHLHAKAPFAQLRALQGERVAAAVQSGVRAYALRYPAEAGPSGRAVARALALLGWTQIALDTPDAIETLDAVLARRALACVLADHEFPPWAKTIGVNHPEVWRSMMAPLIAAELARSTGCLAFSHAPALSLAARQEVILTQP